MLTEKIAVSDTPCSGRTSIVTGFKINVSEPTIYVEQGVCGG